MRSVLSTIVMMLAIANIMAQNIETVRTSNGSVYIGYISEQVPGESMAIYAEKATLILPIDSLNNYRNEERSFMSLSPLAQDMFRALGDTMYVRLVSFDYMGRSYDDVFVVSKTDSEIRFISFAKQTYRLKWDDIVSVEKNQPYSDVYGVRDVILLETGELYRGQVLEQIVGKSIRFRDENGAVRSLLAEDVQSLRSEMVCDTVDRFAQLQLLDRLILNDGSVLEGFISARVMSKKIIFYSYGSDIERHIMLDEISKYQKIWNHNYIAYVEPVDTIKSIRINRHDAVLASGQRVGDNVYLTDYKEITVHLDKRVQMLLHNITVEDDVVMIYKLQNMKVTDRRLKAELGAKLMACNLQAEPEIEITVRVQESADKDAFFRLRSKGLYLLMFNTDEYVVVNVID